MVAGDVELGGDDAIRDYLARPLTILVGTADDARDQYLDTSPEAEASATAASYWGWVSTWACPSTAR